MRLLILWQITLAHYIHIIISSRSDISSSSSSSRISATGVAKHHPPVRRMILLKQKTRLNQQLIALLRRHRCSRCCRVVVVPTADRLPVSWTYPMRTHNTVSYKCRSRHTPAPILLTCFRLSAKISSDKSPHIKRRVVFNGLILFVVFLFWFHYCSIFAFASCVRGGSEWPSS